MDCGVSLPVVSNIDTTSLTEEEQWDMALSLWTTLRDAWAAEAARRQINILSLTPNIGMLDGSICRILMIIL